MVAACDRLRHWLAGRILGHRAHAACVLSCGGGTSGRIPYTLAGVNDPDPSDAARHDRSQPPLFEDTPDLSGDARVMLRGASRPLGVIVAIAAVIVLARPAQWVRGLDAMRDWVYTQGLLGLMVVVAIYIIAAVALVPQSVLKVAAGGLFGSWLGVIMASIGSTLGALACFLIARYVARGPWMQRIKRNPRIHELDLISRERDATLVIVTRILPIFPGNLLNYALGLTRVRVAVFTFWSWLTMLPGVVVLVVGTDAVLRGIAEDRVPWGLVAIVIAMLGLLGASMIFVHRRFRLRAG
jgi:uncharacterized membrane protein YdjX (TVP38/TMEM64 family)